MSSKPPQDFISTPLKISNCVYGKSLNESAEDELLQM